MTKSKLKGSNETLTPFMEVIWLFFCVKFGPWFFNLFFKKLKLNFIKLIVNLTPKHSKTYELDIWVKGEKIDQNIFKCMKTWKTYFKQWNWNKINYNDRITKILGIKKTSN